MVHISNEVHKRDKEKYEKKGLGDCFFSVIPFFVLFFSFQAFPWSVSYQAEERLQQFI